MESSPLMKLAKLIVAAAILYFGYTELWPWLRGQLDDKTAGGGGGGTEGVACIDKASRASDALGGEISRFAQPPHDLAAWDDARSQVEDRIRSATTACICGLESCNRASEALSELSSIVADLDQAIRGEGMALDAARHMEQVDEALNAARQLARQGQ